MAIFIQKLHSFLLLIQLLIGFLPRDTKDIVTHKRTTRRKALPFVFYTAATDMECRFVANNLDVHRFGTDDIMELVAITKVD